MLDAYPGTTETSHSTNFSLEEGLNVTALKMEESYRRMMQNPKIISALKGQQVQVVGGEGRGDASVRGGGSAKCAGLYSSLAHLSWQEGRKVFVFLIDLPPFCHSIQGTLQFHLTCSSPSPSRL